MSASTGSVRRLTVADILRMHADGERLPMLTAYDYPTARILDAAGIPMLLVGDSLGQVLLGYDSTVRVTMTEMLHHTAAVVRGVSRALVIGDMPFLSYASVAEALDNAGRFLREAGATAVKVEGGVRSARTVEALVRAGIPVMGHIGWTPQSQHGMGGKVRVQGKSRETARALLADALAIQEDVLRSLKLGAEDVETYRGGTAEEEPEEERKEWLRSPKHQFRIPSTCEKSTAL